MFREEKLVREKERLREWLIFFSCWLLHDIFKREDMSKKVLIISAVVAIVVGGGLTSYVLLSPKTKEAPSLENVFSPDEAGSQETGVYNDSSGFSFKYPKGVTVADATPDNYYSLLNVSKGNEKLTITVKDGKASDINYPGAQIMGDASLDSVSAKQYKKDGNLITAGIDNGIVYVIEGPADGGFWENAQNTIVSSFSLSESGQSASSGGQGDIIEEEEVVN